VETPVSSISKGQCHPSTASHTPARAVRWSNGQMNGACQRLDTSLSIVTVIMWPHVLGDSSMGGRAESTAPTLSNPLTRRVATGWFALTTLRAVASMHACPSHPCSTLWSSQDRANREHVRLMSLFDSFLQTNKQVRMSESPTHRTATKHQQNQSCCSIN
jgi:hypothetical protein